jgi:Tfp pilus assembly protein PilV
MHASQRRPGVALIEVLVALVMLATSGVALVTLVGQTAHTMRSTSNTEHQLRMAAAQLDRLILLDRAELAAREGQSSLGEWSLRVSAVSPELFDVAISATNTGAILLATTIYRPDTTRATAR